MPWNPKEPLTAWNYPPCAACDEGCEGTPCTCGDSPTSEDDHRRIAELESQLAAVNERCAGLAAALHNNTQSDLIDLMDRCECASLPVKCGACIQREHLLSIEPAYSAILATVREKAKCEGAVDELGELLLWGPTYISAREVLVVKEYRDEIRRRIAALEGKG